MKIYIVERCCAGACPETGGYQRRPIEDYAPHFERIETEDGTDIMAALQAALDLLETAVGDDG